MLSDPSFHLFVYGTLAPGEVNEHILKPLNGAWQSATVNGTLHPEGWGASYGFPAMRLDNDAGPVDGRLFSSIDLPNHWDRLDEFEGSAYKRVTTQVLLSNGEACQANVYTLNDEIVGE